MKVTRKLIEILFLIVLILYFVDLFTTFIYANMFSNLLEINPVFLVLSNSLKGFFFQYMWVVTVFIAYLTLFFLYTVWRHLEGQHIITITPFFALPMFQTYVIYHNYALWFL